MANVQPRRPVVYEAIPPHPSHGFIDTFTASKLGIAAGLVILAAVLGIVLADQAPSMAGTSTLAVSAAGGAPKIVMGHS